MKARLAAGTVLVAVGAALFAVAFRAALSHALEAAAGVGDVVSAMRVAPWWLRLLLPGAGALVAGSLALVASRWPSGRGVTDIMEAVALGHSRLTMRTTLLKSAASWCAIVSGGSIGREGPLMRFGAALGNSLGTRLGLGDDARILIAAGTAAGFAAAYNTPLAAVLFVLEVVAGVFVLDMVVPTLVAVVIGTALTRALVGPGPIYGQRAFALRSPWDLVGYAALGILAALLARVLTLMLAGAETLFARARLPWRAALGGLAAGALVAVIPEVAGNGYEPLSAILDGAMSLHLVAVLLVAKALATTASVSSGSPGGVFTPTMLLGGCLGALLAAGLSRAGITLGVSECALVGMAAATAATTHAPLMSAVMAFELSGDYAIVLPLVLATAAATGMARALNRDSLYTAELRRKGVTWERTLPSPAQQRPL